METLSRGIYEIFTTSLVVILLLITVSGVLLVTDIKSSKARLIAQETSYISSLISNENSEVKLNYKDLDSFKIKEEENKILIMIDNNKNKEINELYIGQEIKVTQTKNIITIKS